MKTSTCKTCIHFDPYHGMCASIVIPSSIGPVLARRSPDAPTCGAYNRKIAPGEATQLFAQNRIQRKSLR